MTLVGCVVPAFNVADPLPAVLEGVRQAVPEAFVIVVDDGSTDGTGTMASRLANEVVSHAANRGKGAALRTGMAAALRQGCSTIVTLDGDGQHTPQAIPSLIAALAQADLVVGSRQRTGTGMPVQRRLSNRLSSAVVSWLAGQRIDDSQSGFRAVRRELVLAVHSQGDRYDQETDFIVRAARAGFRIASVPVPTVYGPASNFRPFRDTALVIRTMVRLGFASSY